MEVEVEVESVVVVVKEEKKDRLERKCFRININKRREMLKQLR